MSPVVWLTVDELAARLRIPKATLYQWRSRGEGPRAVRIGRHLRYRLADVERWEAALGVRAHEGGAPDAA